MSLITWTTTGWNKLKEYEIITRGSDVKLEIDGSNFTEWMKTIATHIDQITFEIIFTHSQSNDNVPHPVYALLTTETIFMTKYGVISLNQVKALVDSIYDGTDELPKYKY